MPSADQELRKELFSLLEEIKATSPTASLQDFKTIYEAEAKDGLTTAARIKHRVVFLRGFFYYNIDVHGL